MKTRFFKNFEDISDPFAFTEKFALVELADFGFLSAAFILSDFHVTFTDNLKPGVNLCIERVSNYKVEPFKTSQEG